MTTEIQALPTPPSPSDTPSDFNSKAFSLLGALPQFVAETNQLGGELMQAAEDAANDAEAARLSKESAAGSALAAGTHAGNAATSAGQAAGSAGSASSAQLAAESARDAAQGYAASINPANLLNRSTHTGTQAIETVEGLVEHMGDVAQWQANPTGVQSINGGQLAGMRNKIINGGFNINQRVYVSGATTTAGQYTLDRWKVTSTAGVTFSTTANKVTVNIPTGQTLQQVIEGLNLQSGNYILSWEGTAKGRIGLGAYGTSGSVIAAITGGVNTTIEFSAGTVSNVQLEAGEVATPFEHRPYSLERSLCRWYTRKQRVAVHFTAPIAGASGSSNINYEMRAAPTVINTANVHEINVIALYYEEPSDTGLRFTAAAPAAGPCVLVQDLLLVSEL